MKPLVIHHADCIDGFTAAWVFSRFYDREVELYPGVYQNEPPDVTDREVFLVDFSYKREVVERMLFTAKSITLLDHHKSAIEDLRPLMESGRIRHVVDTDRSGARIAWDFCSGFYHKPPLLVQYVEDRDLWRFKLDHSREINEVIFSYDLTLDNWDELGDRFTLAEFDQGRFDNMVGEGAALLRRKMHDIDFLLPIVTREMNIGGTVVPVANLPIVFTSEAGTKLCEQKGTRSAPYAACYWDTPQGRVFSLRSLEGGADVSEIAKRYGGGGHKHAAGFRVPLNQVEQFEIPALRLAAA